MDRKNSNLFIKYNINLIYLFNCTTITLFLLTSTNGIYTFCTVGILANVGYTERPAKLWIVRNRI